MHSELVAALNHLPTCPSAGHQCLVSCCLLALPMIPILGSPSLLHEAGHTPAGALIIKSRDFRDMTCDELQTGASQLAVSGCPYLLGPSSSIAGISGGCSLGPAPESASGATQLSASPSCVSSSCSAAWLKPSTAAARRWQGTAQCVEWADLRARVKRAVRFKAPSSTPSQ